MPNLSVGMDGGVLSAFTFSRSEIMRAAWAIMRRSYTFGDRFVFGRAGRSRFAAALKQAWHDAKAALGLLTVEQIARDERAAAIRVELEDIQYRDWRFDYAGGRRRLEAELAALAA